MSITKDDDLNFDHEFPGYRDNDNHSLEFTTRGLDIHYDTLSWDDIKAAHKILFNQDIDKTE